MGQSQSYFFFNLSHKSYFLLISSIFNTQFQLMSISLQILILLIFGPPNPNTLKNLEYQYIFSRLKESVNPKRARRGRARQRSGVFICNRIRIQLPGERYGPLKVQLTIKSYLLLYFLPNLTSYLIGKSYILLNLGLKSYFLLIFKTNLTSY